MALHPLRKYLLALEHPEGLQGARRDLAARLRCHPDSVRNIDSGYVRPSWTFALAIERETGVKPDKLMRAVLTTERAA